MERIDNTDRRILAALQRAGRMTNAELSDKVHLSPSACHRRVQRLQADGVIRDYVALLDARKLDRPTTVFVEITLSGQADEVLEAFEREVARIPDRAGMPSDGRDGGLSVESGGARYRRFRPYSPSFSGPPARRCADAFVWSHCGLCSKPRPCQSRTALTSSSLSDA